MVFHYIVVYYCRNNGNDEDKFCPYQLLCILKLIISTRNQLDGTCQISHGKRHLIKQTHRHTHTQEHHPPLSLPLFHSLFKLPFQFHPSKRRHKAIRLTQRHVAQPFLSQGLSLLSFTTHDRPPPPPCSTNWKNETFPWH